MLRILDQFYFFELGPCTHHQAWYVRLEDRFACWREACSRIERRARRHAKAVGILLKKRAGRLANDSFVDISSATKCAVLWRPCVDGPARGVVVFAVAG